MLKGVIFALAACFSWGLIFVVPQFMEGFSSLEISVGLYFFYGTISLILLFQQGRKNFHYYTLSLWFKSLYFSFISSIVYYTCVVLAMRYSSPAVCALILGISPITIAFYGNWKQKRSYSNLIIPSLLIVCGLILINAPHFYSEASIYQYLIGLVCSFLALIAWSWYVVANANFLKTHPHIPSADWSTLMGVSTLVWVGICSLLMMICFKDQLELYKYLTWNHSLSNFLIGCAILGSLSAWGGAFLWNRASSYLPIELAGQLTIFETIFGLFFVYAVDKSLPSLTDCCGISLLLGAVIYGIRQTYLSSVEFKRSSQVSEMPLELVMN